MPLNFKATAVPVMMEHRVVWLPCGLQGLLLQILRLHKLHGKQVTQSALLRHISSLATSSTGVWLKNYELPIHITQTPTNSDVN